MHTVSARRTVTHRTRRAAPRRALPVLVGLLVVAALSAALLGKLHLTASLVPTVAPGTATGFTLEDVWNKITNNAYTATNGGHAVTPSDTPANPTSLHTVSDIFDAITPIDATKMLSTLTVQGVTGTIPTQTLSASTHSVPAGYYAATDLTTVDSRLQAGNIKQGSTIFGILGSFTGSGSEPWYSYGDSDPNKVLTSAQRGGNYNAVNLVPGNVKNTVVFGTGSVGAYPSPSYPLSSAGATGSPATANQILTGHFLGSGTGAIVQGSVSGGSNVTGGNGSLSFAIPSGLYSGAETCTATDSNLTAGNIKKNTALFGVTGAYPSASYPLSSAGATGTPATAANLLSTYYLWSATGAIVQGSYTCPAGGYTYGDSSAGKVLTTAQGQGTYDATLLTAATVKSGTHFGVNSSSVGDYPSATNTLPGAAGTDLAGNGTTITTANGLVEWYKSDGTRQTATLHFPAPGAVCPTDSENGTTGTLTLDPAKMLTSASYCGVSGTIPIVSTTSTGATASSASAGTNYFTAPRGYYDGTKKVSVPDAGIVSLNANLTANKIASGATIFGVKGTYKSPYWPATKYQYTLTDNDYTVTDSSTNLMWTACPLYAAGTIQPTDNTSFPPYANCDPGIAEFTWSEALTACSGSFGGHNDWRLPSPSEIFTIVDPTQNQPAIDLNYFGFYGTAWTNQTNTSYPSDAFFVDLGYGFVDANSKNNTNDVICVRTAS
jgi:hypothetical protein